MAPAFFRLRAEGIDVEALREPATGWLRASEDMGASPSAADILTQVADAVRHEDLHFLQDDLAAMLHGLLGSTGAAVTFLQALTADTLTLTPEGHWRPFRARAGRCAVSGFGLPALSADRSRSVTGLWASGISGFYASHSPDRAAVLAADLYTYAFQACGTDTRMLAQAPGPTRL